MTDPATRDSGPTPETQTAEEAEFTSHSEDTSHMTMVSHDDPKEAVLKVDD